MVHQAQLVKKEIVEMKVFLGWMGNLGKKANLDVTENAVFKGYLVQQGLLVAEKADLDLPDQK